MPRPTKLTREQVQEIRLLARDPEASYKQLAASYGVAYSTIANVVQGLTWKERGYHPRTKPRNKLDWPKVREIRRRYAAGEKGYELAAEFGVSNVAVHFITIGKNWRHDPEGFVWDIPEKIRGSRPKLNPEQVAAIAANMKRTVAQLAMDYEVSEELIRRVKKGTYRRAA